jgi:hypothetical protein
MASLSKPDGIPFYVKICKSPQENNSNDILISRRKIPSSLRKVGRLGKNKPDY